MNVSQNSIKLAGVEAELAAGLVSIADQTARLDTVIAHGGNGAQERIDLWKMEVDQAGLWARQSALLDRIALVRDPMVVLVVEDQVLLLMATAADLRCAGFVVVEASSADEALEQLRCNPSIRAVFTDVQMPGTMDGLELARTVHARWPAIKVVISSGNAQFGIGDLTVGDRFVRKPYRAENVISALRDH